jgi:release factor glutamine methyltransferase
MTTIAATLEDAYRRLGPTSTSARLDAQILLAETLKVDRAYVLAYGERELTPDQAAAYESWITRREGGEPVAYLLGRRAFYDRELIVSPAVLIPRPETELLLEMAIAWAEDRPSLTAVDVGTGSGALAVTFKAHVPGAQVYATDLSPDALAIARRNAEAHGVEVTLMKGDLLAPVIGIGLSVDLVMANLPYITSGDLPALEVSRHEPILALDGGADGLDLVRRLLAQIPRVCEPGALALLEIGAGQGAAVLEAARSILRPAQIDVFPDYAGHDRIVRIVV